MKGEHTLVTFRESASVFSWATFPQDVACLHSVLLITILK